MANDRDRYERNRYRDRSESPFGDDRRTSGWNRSDDGYIARRGFGNTTSGYERRQESSHDEDRRFEDRGDRSRERDFGDSAGYGTGGSARDWRDVVGDDRGRDWSDPNTVWGRDEDRSGSSSFGRGSRDYNEDRGFFERAGDEIRSWFGDDETDRRRDRDMRGEHRGRGPKGYQRSDERIREDVNDRLTDDHHIDASEIDVAVVNREVTLNGTVGSRFEKRHAEDLAESVSGVTHVQNNLRIQQAAGMGMGGSMMSGAGAAGAGSTGSPDMTRNEATADTSDAAAQTETGATRRRTTST